MNRQVGRKENHNSFQVSIKGVDSIAFPIAECLWVYLVLSSIQGDDLK